MKNNGFYIDSFFCFANLLTNLENLKKTIRWGILPKVGMVRKQSSYDHTMELTLMALVIGSLVSENYSITQFNPFRLAVLAFLHDLGENKLYSGAPGDIIVRDKEKNNNHRLEELKVFYNFFNPLILKKGTILKKLAPVYLSQYSNEPREVKRLLSESNAPLDWQIKNELEVKVFEFVEKMGYVIFIYQEYLQNSKSLPLLVQVLRENADRLYDLSKKVKGLEKFYDLEEYEKIKKFLESHKDLPDPLSELENEI